MFASDKDISLEELLKIKWMFEELQSIAHVGTWEWDILNNISTWSDEAYRIYGIDPKSQINYEVVADFRHPDDAESLEKALHDAVNEKKPYNTEYRIIRKDGEIRYIRGHGKVYCDADGAPVRLFGTIQDVTEQKLLDTALKESEQRYRALLSASSEVLYRKTPDWSIMSQLHSQGFLANTENPSISWLDAYIHPEDQHHVALAIEEAIRTKNVFELEHRVFRKDGTLGWTHSRAIPIINENNEIVEWFGAASDITERKEAEAALRESEEKYRELFNSIDQGFCTVEVLFDKKQKPIDHRFLIANPAFERQTGLKNVIGRCMRQMVPLHEEHWFQIFGEITLTGEPRRFENAAAQLGCYYEISAWRVGEPEQHRVAILSNDITNRKKVEEALRESESNARALVAELEKADENKNQFISVLSHELRNPLATIAAGLSIIEVSNDRTQIEKAIQIMRRQSAQLCKLVDDLLDMTRITQNKIQLRKEIVDIGEIVRHAAEDFKPEYHFKGLQIWQRIPTQPIHICADPVRITQCIGNLLHNALKFTHENGTVGLSLKKEKGYAVISVQDNGIGIRPEKLQQLFEPFIQADYTLNRKVDGGLGLGLSIVQGIIEMHNGKVTAHSEGLGKGALFTLTLPVAQENKCSPEKNTMDTCSSQYKVLFIEDNRDLAGMLCSIMELLGHEADAAYDGIEGVERAKEIKPDIIFCDIGLPDINGYEVARTIRRDDELNNVYLVALTGYARDSDAERVRESGFDRHLGKPVDMAKIQHVLSEYASKRAFCKIWYNRGGRLDRRRQPPVMMAQPLDKHSRVIYHHIWPFLFIIIYSLTGAL